MVRFFAQAVLTVLGNAAGLWAASLVIDGFHLSLAGFILSVLFFTAAQIILAPFVLKMAIQYVPSLRGGIALVTTLVVLLLTVLFTDAVQVSGVSAWILAPLVIWVTTVFAGVVLPLFLFKKALGRAPTDGQTKRTIPSKKIGD